MSSDPNATGMNRRQFLALATVAAVGTGCDTAENGGGAATGEARTLDAGPVANYAADGVYGGFRDQGFFVFRHGEKLAALSSYCTHRKCKLTAEPDRSFYCKCHGSTFDPDGNVTTGPAKRNLPELPSLVDEHGRLLVKVSEG